MREKKRRRRINAKGKRAIATIIIAILAICVITAVLVIVNRQKNTEIPQKNKIAETESVQNEEAQEPNEEKNTETENKNEMVWSESETKIEDTKILEEVQARGYCNSFAGYTSAIIANGGLTTQEGSYYAQAGINVSIEIEDNDDVIIEAFKNGEIDFFYMTVNKMALICKELKEAGVDVVIPYLSDSSTGGDGIVAKAEYDSIEALKDTKIAMARNSVSSAVPVWFMNMSNLKAEDIETIIDNFALYDSTQEAVEAFVQGECGAVSTWDMNTALNTEGSQLLFSTKEGEYLVIDGLIVNKAYMEEHPEIVKAMVDGCIQVSNDFSSGKKEEESYDIIRASVPDFADYDNKTMKELLASSQFLGYQKNVEAFDIAEGIYVDFCKIWEQLGFETDPEYVAGLFDKSVLEALTEKWEGNEILPEKETIVATEEAIIDKEALISKSYTILFKKDSWEFLEGAEEENYAKLDEFVKIAKVLNKMIIKVEGHISLKPGEKATEFGWTLAIKRAEVAKDYMVKRGIEDVRIIPIADIDEEPKIANASPEEKEMERNCTISIYTGEE